MEARSIIDSMGPFLRDELKLDPDAYCYPAHINPDHVWDPEKRTCMNPTVDFLLTLVDDTKDLQIEGDHPGAKVFEEEFDMTSKEEREFRRTVGLDDTETVTDLKAKRQPRPSKIPNQVGGEAKSIRSWKVQLMKYEKIRFSILILIRRMKVWRIFAQKKKIRSTPKKTNSHNLITRNTLMTRKRFRSTIQEESLIGNQSLNGCKS